jgi:hypothetical protein
MDGNEHRAGADGPGAPGLHRLHRVDLRPNEPADFVPLRLVLHPGGSVIDVDRPDVVVGRHTEADVRLPLPDVSRRHCRLQFVEGCWQVIDMQSLNGVFVNGEMVLQAPLVEGDLLRIGSFTFSIELGRAPEAPAAIPEAKRHVLSILRTLAQPDVPKRKAS